MREVRVAALVGLVAACAASCSFTLDFGALDKGGAGGSAGSGGGGGTGGAGGSADGGPSAALKEACQKASDALCLKFDTCGPALVKATWGDVATCKTRFEADCTSWGTAPGTTTTPAFITSCADAFKNVSCDDAFRPDVVPACIPPAGPRDDGAKCGEAGQCKSSYCKRDTNQSCGACKARSGEGGPCDKAEDCAAGLTCARADKKCVKFGGMGAACGPAKPCLPTLGCKGTQPNQVCATPTGPAQPCAYDWTKLSGNDAFNELTRECQQLQGYYCKPGALVTSNQGTCTLLNFTAAGSACGMVGEQLVACAASAECLCKDGGATCAKDNRKCFAPLSDGAGCSASAVPGCFAPAECIAGLCAVPDPKTCG